MFYLYIMILSSCSLVELLLIELLLFKIFWSHNLKIFSYYCG